MKLFLNGGGAGASLNAVYKMWAEGLDERKSILYIPLAMQSDRYDGCLKWIIGELKDFKLKISMVRSALELSLTDLTDFSGIFIGGGNTFKLLKGLKEQNMTNKIKDYLLSGGSIFGGSAGAIIFGKDIYSCALVDDNSKIGLTDTSGLNYINNISLLCHYMSDYQESKKNIEYLKRTFTNDPIFYLSETHTIIVNEESIEILGQAEFCSIINGALIYFNKYNEK